jgi:hypothetical protein
MPRCFSNSLFQDSDDTIQTLIPWSNNTVSLEFQELTSNQNSQQLQFPVEE